MIFEPESWTGLRSERAVAGGFAPAVPDALAAPAHPAWPRLRAAMRRLGLFLHR